MHSRLGRTLYLALLAGALVSGAMASVDSHARIVRLSYVDGQVQMDRDGARGLETAFLNMPLAQGSRVATGSEGYAEIEFENGSTIRLTPGSETIFREMGTRGDSRVTLVDLNSGTAYFNIKGDSDDDFRVLLQGQEIRVAKSARFRIRLERESAQISVMKGELQLTGENEVRVKRDETLTLDFQDRGRYFLARSIETLSSDAWNHERDEYRDRYSSDRYGRYGYGASDLSYYGSYISVPGYGDCWRPYGYGASWDPFMDGAWVWYPRFGYVWVSSYPWGWAPYRYGRWIWASGSNWCWQPGPTWSSWYYYPIIYRAPSWYGWDRCHPPRRRHHHGGNVIVVGGGPYTGRPGRRDDRDRVGPGGIGKPGAPKREIDRRVVIGGGGSGGERLPSALTPGLLPEKHTVDELKRVHGEDLGLAKLRRVDDGDGVVARPPAVTSDGGATTRPATPRSLEDRQIDHRNGGVVTKEAANETPSAPEATGAPTPAQPPPTVTVTPAAGGRANTPYGGASPRRDDATGPRDSGSGSGGSAPRSAGPSSGSGQRSGGSSAGGSSGAAAGSGVRSSGSSGGSRQVSSPPPPPPSAPPSSGSTARPKTSPR